MNETRILKLPLTVFTFTVFVFAIAFSLSAQDISPAKLRTLYNSLDPKSIAQHLAFYDLYSDTPEGQQTLQDAYSLLSGGAQINAQPSMLPTTLLTSIQAIVGLVNKLPGDEEADLNATELWQIEQLAGRLPNRRLAGFRATSEAQVMALPPDQIDLARGILLSQLGSNETAFRKIRNYEAAIDLMALQILTRVGLNDSPKTKIRAINHYIFEEMGFRFPPHSTFAKDVDLYTFLPSVLDSRRGVCLGVSILYICLAQRLNLDLEIVTPPGHIFVRWHKNNQEINIETTARGVNLPTEEYLGVDTRKLEQRNIKETIGMAHFNQASVFWERQEYDKVLASYLKSQPYLPDDKQLVTLMGYAYMLNGDEEEGKKLLHQVVGYLPDHSVSKDTLAEDFFSGNVDVEGIRAVFMRVNETRESLITKRTALEDVLKKYPRFREGIFSLAGTWLQLHRTGEALEVLEQYHHVDPTNAPTEYYLAALYAERLDYNKAWKHFRIAESLVHERHHDPKALLDLKQELAERCPE
ncbi:MAG: transglutaminase family protein [Parachlamydiaceae bacterium]